MAKQEDRSYDRMILVSESLKKLAKNVKDDSDRIRFYKEIDDYKNEGYELMKRIKIRTGEWLW